MKRNRLALLLTALILISLSCTQSKKFKQQMDPKKTICYTATDRADTAWLRIDTANQQVLGKLEFNFHNQQHFVGDVKGIVKGDTLKGHYVFKVNKADKWHRNPIALLKQTNTLTMGVGEVKVMWGAVFFDDKKPVDYNKGRFVFEQVGCAIK